MSSATEMWLSAEKMSAPTGSRTTVPSAWPCRFLGAPQPSAGYSMAALFGDDVVGVDIVGTPIRLWNRAVRRLPGDRKFIDAVGEAVVLERHFAERDRQAQRGDALDQGMEHDLKLRTC